MQKNKAFTDWLASELKSRAWSMSELARRSRISRSLVTSVMSGLEPSWEFCAAIAPALEVSPVEILLLSGKLTPLDVSRALPALSEQKISTAQQLMALIRELDDEDKRLLLRITHGLVLSHNIK